MPIKQTHATEQAITFTDYEGNEVLVNTNGDATQYGAFLEVQDHATATAVTAHMTPEQMADLGRWLLSRAGLL